MGLRVPIVNASMGGVAGGRLAGAVTAAASLGMVGMGSTASTSTLETELRHVRGVTGPFGIGLVDWVIRKEPGLLDAALATRPTPVSPNLQINNGFSYQRTVTTNCTPTQRS
jgi:nitronate monooxygenase